MNVTYPVILLRDSLHATRASCTTEARIIRTAIYRRYVRESRSFGIEVIVTNQSSVDDKWREDWATKGVELSLLPNYFMNHESAVKLKVFGTVNSPCTVDLSRKHLSHKDSGGAFKNLSSSYTFNDGAPNAGILSRPCTSLSQILHDQTRPRCTDSILPRDRAISSHQHRKGRPSSIKAICVLSNDC